MICGSQNFSRWDRAGLFIHSSRVLPFVSFRSYPELPEWCFVCHEYTLCVHICAITLVGDPGNSLHVLESRKRRCSKCQNIGRGELQMIFTVSTLTTTSFLELPSV